MAFGGVGRSDSDDVRCHLPSDPVTVSSRMTCKLHAQSSRDSELSLHFLATIPGWRGRSKQIYFSSNQHVGFTRQEFWLLRIVMTSQS